MEDVVLAPDGELTEGHQQEIVRAQLARIETKLDEVLAFRDLLLETAAPFLTGGKSKVWLALLAKSKGART